MTEGAQVFLGIIAVATLLMALAQVAAIAVAVRLARHVQLTLTSAQQTIVTAQQTIASLREEIRPLITNATTIAEEASRSATLAAAQVEKVDGLVTELARRVDETAAVVQEAVVRPAREGLALVAALKAGLAVLRPGGDPRRRASRSEEEDPLFIG